MNTAQHAGRILNAWKTADDAALADALGTAQRSCHSVRSVNRFENEKQEVLESVIEHLQMFQRTEQLPAYSRAAAAATLLAHLSSDLTDQNIYRTEHAFYTAKN